MSTQAYEGDPKALPREGEANGGVAPRKRKARSKGSKTGAELERLVEAWLQLAGWKTHRAAAAGLVKLPGGRAFVKSHDLFGVFDMLAHKRCDHGTQEPCAETRAVQCTAPSDRGVRRAKIQAAGPYPQSWLVSMIVHKSARVGRETKHWFLVEDLRDDGTWSEPESVEVDVTALEAHRSAVHAAKKARRACGS